MKIKHIIPIIIALCIGLASCHKIPVGYLHADKAEFAPKTVHFYHTPNEYTPRANNANIPWSTIRIQGVAGTNPINYEFVDVEATNGGDAEKFKAINQAGHLNVQGGIVQISQEGVKMLPIGSYSISLRVFNDGYSQILKDILIIEIGDNEPDEI